MSPAADEAAPPRRRLTPFQRIVLALFLQVRLALWVSIGIPISLLFSLTSHTFHGSA